MTVIPNGTEAKDIALHFVKMTTGRATPVIMKRTVNQAKSLLQSGYSKEEIIKVIDYIVNTKKADMYSLGYVTASINTMLKEITEQEAKLTAKVTQKKIEEQFAQPKEVITNSESTTRNREKSTRFGLQCRFGEEFTFNLPEGHGEDN